MKPTFIIFFFITLFTIKGYAQPSWKLVKEKNGIKVFVAGVDNSKFKSIRVNAIFDGTISKLVSIVANMNKAAEWVYKTKTAYIVKQVTPLEFFYYSETAMPWPVSNRDVVIHMVIKPDPAQHTLVINALNAPALIEARKGTVRIPYSKASWLVTEAHNKLTIDYIFEVDPGGSLPAWLVNLMADKGPYETFHKLKMKLRQ